MNRLTTKAGFALALITALFPAIVNAQPEPVKTAREAVIESISKLDDLKDATDLSPAEKLKLETDLKREALGNIIALSRLETESIETKLKSLSLDDRFDALRKEFLVTADEYLAYFDAKKTQLKTTLDLESIQAIAGDLKDWRKETYDPGVSRMVDVVLVFQNLDALKTAEGRLEKTAADLKRRTPKPKVAWQPVVTKASINLRDARAWSDKAMTMIETYLPTRTDLTIELPESQTITKDQPTVRTLVENSLLELKKAYQKLISLNDLLKN